MPIIRKSVNTHPEVVLDPHQSNIIDTQNETDYDRKITRTNSGDSNPVSYTHLTLPTTPYV